MNSHCLSVLLADMVLFPVFHSYKWCCWECSYTCLLSRGIPQLYDMLNFNFLGCSQSTFFPECWSQLKPLLVVFSSVQFSSVAQLCLTLCDPMNYSTPGFPVHHQLPEFTQTHVHRVIDAIQPSHPLLSPSPPALNPSQHQSLFQWVNSSHEVAKVLEFQL